MSASADLLSAPTVFDRLRTELADLAYDLERQGRLDAADVVMQLDARVRVLAETCSASTAPTFSNQAGFGEPALHPTPVEPRTARGSDPARVLHASLSSVFP